MTCFICACKLMQAHLTVSAEVREQDNIHKHVNYFGQTSYCLIAEQCSLPMCILLVCIVSSWCFAIVGTYLKSLRVLFGKLPIGVCLEKIETSKDIS